MDTITYVRNFGSSSACNLLHTVQTRPGTEVITAQDRVARLAREHGINDNLLFTGSDAQWNRISDGCYQPSLS